MGHCKESLFWSVGRFVRIPTGRRWSVEASWHRKAEPRLTSQAPSRSWNSREDHGEAGPSSDMDSKILWEEEHHDPRGELCIVLTELRTTRLPPSHDWIVALFLSAAGPTTTIPRGSARDLSGNGPAVVLLRSLDHDAAGGIRYTATKNPSLNRLSRCKISKKSASRCRQKNASSKTPGDDCVTSNLFNATKKSDSTSSLAATNKRRRTGVESFTVLGC